MSCRVAGPRFWLFTGCLTAEFVKAGGKGEEWQDWEGGGDNRARQGGGGDGDQGGGSVLLPPALRGRFLRSHWQVGA